MLYFVSVSDRPRPYDLGVHATEAKPASDFGIGESEGIRAKTRRKFRTASVGLCRHFDDRGADLEQAARRQVVDADVEVHVQLITR